MLHQARDLLTKHIATLVGVVDEAADTHPHPGSPSPCS